MSTRAVLEGDRVEGIAEVQTGLMRMGKRLVRPLVFVLGRLCCSNNPQMLGAYKNKCLLLTYIARPLRMAVRELQVFAICLLHS